MTAGGAPAGPRRVVVTGVGCLGAYGFGLEALGAALASGRALATPVDRDGGYHLAHGARLAARVPDLDLTPWLSPMAGRRMSALSRHAVVAARMAMEHAGLAGVPPDRLGVSLATAFGPGTFTEQLVRQIQEKGGRAASPFLFTDCVANAAAGQIAIDLQARGPNTTLCQREAGPLLAVQQGARDLAHGRVDVCLAGAVEEIEPLVHAILDRFRTLARKGADGRELPRPFARGRNGVLAGGGATVLVLETEDHALARGARVLARLTAGARAFDPTAGRAAHGTDVAGLAAAARTQLGGALADVDAVISGAGGSRRGDRLEAGVLRELFAELPPVLVPKAVHGEYAGGTLATAVLALCGVRTAMPEGCTDPDPACGVTPFAGELHATSLLATAHAAGGAAAWLCLHRP